MFKATCIFLSFILICCSSKKNQAKVLFEEANSLRAKKNYSKALLKIDSAIQIDNSKVAFFVTKSRIFSAIKEYETSIKILESLNSNNEFRDTINFELAKTFFSYASETEDETSSQDVTKNRYEKAIYYFTNAIENNRNFYAAYIEKAKCLISIESYAKAIRVLETTSKLFPDSSNVKFMKGAAKISSGDLYVGKRELLSLIKRKKLDSSQIAQAYGFIGFGYDKKNDLDSAIKYYTESIQYDSMKSLTFYVRAVAYNNKGLKYEACDDYRRAADLGSVKANEAVSNYCKKFK